MKILYIHQYFRTPQEGGAIRSYYLAKALVEEGYQVEMIAAHNDGTYEARDVEGIKVHYLPVPYQNEYGFWRRILAFIRFYRSAYKLVEKIEGISLVYATSTPLSIGWLALKIKRKLGLPYIFEARDLWPDAPIEMGAVRNRWLKKALFRMEKKIYAHAEELVALSPPVKKILETRSGGLPTRLIPNMADTDFFRPEYQDKDLIRRLKTGSEFVICYFGAIGKVNQLDNLIDLAVLSFEERLPVKFLIIGRGAMLPSVQNLAALNGLSNVFFFPHMDKDELRRYLSVSDAAFVSFAAAKTLETSSPNKFFDALAAGKIILYNKKGWIRQLITQEQCGIFADPGDPERTIERLKELINSPEELKRRQTNAARLAERYSRRALTSEFVEMIRRYDRSPSLNQACILTA